MAAPPQTFRIAGIVVDEINRAPLARARVSITCNCKDKPLVESVQTDGEGHFAFENLQSGKYSLSAERRGYGTQSFQQHEWFSTSIVVGTAADSEHILFGLLPQAAISGQVTDDATGPVRDAEIVLFRKSRGAGKTQIQMEATQRTDDQGLYRFAGLRAGTYYVGVNTRPWYAQFAVPLMHFELKGPNGENLDLNIREESSTGVVSSTFVSAGGSAQGFSIMQSGGGLAELRAATNAAEAAAISVNASETLQEPSPLEVVYPLTYFQDATDAAAAAAIALRPGDSEIADFNLHAIPAVRMRIRTHKGGSESEDQVGAPQVEYAQRGLGNYAARIPTEAVQIEPGIMEVSGLPPGPLAITVAGGQSNVDAGRTTEFDASGEAASIAIRRTLQFEDGTPLQAQADIALRDRASGALLMSATSKDGTMVFHSPAGIAAAYDVLLVNSEGLAVKSMSASGAKTSGQTVEITGTQDVQLTITISKTSASINGVALREGKPLAGVMILLVPVDSEHKLSLFRQAQSDSDGTFSLSDVMAGKYTAVAIENGWELDWADARVLASYLASGERLDVAAERSYDVKVQVVAAKTSGASTAGSSP